MAQYPIPQFIEAEGKIISFLTFRQFFIIVGGGAACAVLYYTVPFYPFLVSSFFIGAITAGIAFLKIDDQGIVTLIMNVLGFSLKSKNYVWKKKSSPYKMPEPLITPEPQESKIQKTQGVVEYRKK